MKILLNPLKMAFLFFSFLFLMLLSVNIFFIQPEVTIFTLIGRSFNCSIIFSLLGMILSFTCKYLLFTEDDIKEIEEITEETLSEFNYNNEFNNNITNIEEYTTDEYLDEDYIFDNIDYDDIPLIDDIEYSDTVEYTNEYNEEIDYSINTNNQQTNNKKVIFPGINFDDIYN